MRSPDDDDEVHNSISKLLWLRQPLSAHLSSLFVRSAFWWELIWNSNVVGVTKIIFNVVPIPRISLDHNKTQNSAPKFQLKITEVDFLIPKNMAKFAPFC